MQQPHEMNTGIYKKVPGGNMAYFPSRIRNKAWIPIFALLINTAVRQEKDIKSMYWKGRANNVISR